MLHIETILFRNKIIIECNLWLKEFNVTKISLGKHQQHVLNKTQKYTVNNRYIYE